MSTVQLKGTLIHYTIASDGKVEHVYFKGKMVGYGILTEAEHKLFAEQMVTVFRKALVKANAPEEPKPDLPPRPIREEPLVYGSEKGLYDIFNGIGSIFGVEPKNGKKR